MKDDNEKLRAWVEGWKETGKVLEELRCEEIRNSNLAESIKSFDTAFRSAIWREPPIPYSGLIEFHRVLGKLK